MALEKMSCLRVVFRTQEPWPAVDEEFLPLATIIIAVRIRSHFAGSYVSKLRIFLLKILNATINNR
jgi:hypothetical protein